MVKLRLKQRKIDGPLVRNMGGKRYEITYENEVDMPLKYAISIMYSLDYTFTEQDKKDFSKLGEHQLSVLKRVTNTKLDDEVKATLGISTRKPMFAKKSKPSIVEKEEEKPTKEKASPLPPDLDKLTVKQLQVLLAERDISAKGRKADLIKALTESE